MSTENKLNAARGMSDIAVNPSSATPQAAPAADLEVRPSLAGVDATEVFADLLDAIRVAERWITVLSEKTIRALRPLKDGTDQFGFGGRRDSALRRSDAFLDEASGLLEQARRDLRRDSLKLAVTKFCAAAAQCAVPSVFAEGGAAFGRLVLAVGKFCALEPDIRSNAERGVSEGHAGIDYWDLVDVSDETEFESELRILSGGCGIKPLDDVSRLPGSPSLPTFPPLAELISRATSAALPQEPTRAASARQESKTRISGVEFEGFRGSPHKTSLDFLSRDGTPSSVLIFGDNGVGKSTIVDAVEFAIQGRIGRSADFESSLAPAAVSFAAGGFARAAVRLSDGTTVERNILVNASGRYQGESHRDRRRLFSESQATMAGLCC